MTGLGPFTASISGLSASTTYHFQAVAVGSTTVTGSDASFITSAGGGGTAPPHQFYGNVYINGSPATAGATVAASVNGSPAASTTTDGSGRYGYTTLFLVPGTSGGVVTFYVNGSLVPQTTTWTSGGMTRLNLYRSDGGGTLTITCPTSTGTTGVAYSSSIVVTGGTPSYTCSITGSLPPGLTRTNLAISGTPTTNGTYPFTVQVTDSASPANTGTASCSITISSPGVLTMTGPLSSGQIGVDYSSSIVVTGGTSPYTCSITGSLPPGLTRTNLAISGMPTTNGTYPFTVQVTDSASPANTGTQSCSITIGTTSGPLLGTGATGTGTGSPSIVRLVKFTASGTGNVNEIRVYSLVGGNVKVALYDADSAGAPRTLLNATTTSTLCTAYQWNTISLPTATSVTNGAIYWIGVADESGAGACYSYTSPIFMYWTYITYSSYVFPNPAGSGYTISPISWYMAYTGWGN
jgi:hypothetical protein